MSRFSNFSTLPDRPKVDEANIKSSSHPGHNNINIDMIDISWVPDIESAKAHFLKTFGCYFDGVSVRRS
jgi:hypothetical protein